MKERLLSAVFFCLFAPVVFAAESPAIDAPEIVDKWHQALEAAYPGAGDGDMHKMDSEMGELEAPDNLPLADGKITCTTCHTSLPSAMRVLDNPPLNLRMSVENSELCLACHTGRDDHTSHPLTKLDEKYYPGVEKLGGILGNGGVVTCLSCHAPHGSHNENYLRATAEGMELCQSCHIEKFPSAMDSDDLAITHIMNLAVDEEEVKSAVMRVSGRLGPDGELICFTCHSVHHAESERTLLLANNVDSEFCQMCHEQEVFDTPHDMRYQENYKSLSGRSAEDLGPCSSCHGSHGSSIKPAENATDRVNALCLSCHSVDGPAARKIPAYYDHSHVFKMLPDKEIFEEYLTGRHQTTLTCTTCHNPHVWSTDPEKMEELAENADNPDYEGDIHSSFLRDDTAESFCANCHTDAAERFAGFHKADFRGKKLAPGSKTLLDRILGR